MGRELSMQRREEENRAARALGSSAIEHDYGYVSFGSPPAFHSGMLSMVEEGGKMGIAREGLRMSGLAVYSAMHSKVEEGGKQGIVGEGLCLNGSEVCMVRKRED